MYSENTEMRPARTLDLSKVTSILIFIGGILTLVSGLITVYQRAVGELTFKWCNSFASEQCNPSWEQLFTFDIEKVARVWQPFVIGAHMVSMSFPSMRKDCLVPATWIQAFWLCLFEAFFGNFAYFGALAFLTGIYNLICALLCLVITFVAARNFRPFELYQ
eukprot:GEMP01072402.1.p1 GENE.GEMP01072402.1~~GEMP01072402.1.p1  ORF type:complete len:162 (+),score=12.76 GEMP01072402.1:20-505(+)